jgi:hypothetical protein
MVVSKSSHCVVAVIIVRLEANIDSFLLADLLCSGNEVLRQQLLLFVKVVTGALQNCQICHSRRLVEEPYHVNQDV